MATGGERSGRSRFGSAFGAIPVVGDLARQVETQAKWIQELVEQNARLVGQLPATVKTFNDSLERFNQTVSRLDRAVTRIEATSAALAAPVERLSGVLDPRALRELPELVQSLRTEALPALRAATDTQRQVATVQATLDRVVSVVADLPGAGILRRMAAPRDAAPSGSSQDNASQDNASQDNASQDQSSQDKAGQDQSSQDEAGPGARRPRTSRPPQ